MRFRDLFDLSLGRLILPLRSVVSTIPGELWLNGVNVYLRSSLPPSNVLMRLLTDLDIGTTVAPLVNGQIPTQFIPGGNNGGGGGLSGSERVGQLVMMFCDPSKVPADLLVLDGEEQYIDDYPELFSVLGYKHGLPTTFDRFRLPNCYGRSPVGAVGGQQANTGPLRKIAVTNGGSGYTDGTYNLTLQNGTFATAATVQVLVAGGAVTRVRVVTGGDYTDLGQPVAGGPSNCAVRIPVEAVAGLAAGNGFTYAVYAANQSSAFAPWGARMTNRGAGYTATPDVVVSVGSLVGATAVAIMEGGTVREILVTNPGRGDPAGATFTLSGGAPTTPATADLVLWSTVFTVGDTGGEQQRKQLTPEVADHKHNLKHNRQGVGSVGGGDRDFPAPGAPADYDVIGPVIPTNGQPYPATPPLFGVLMCVKAK